MKLLWSILVILILLLQARLWAGEGSYVQVRQLQSAIDEQKAENTDLSVRNQRLFAEVANLRVGEGAIEERARMNLGLVGQDETFFLVVDP